MSLFLNLAFHRVVELPRDIQSEYDVDLRFLQDVLGKVRSWVASSGRVQGLRVYFDDNHRSNMTLVLPVLSDANVSVVSAVPVASIGSRDCCSFEDLAVLAEAGWSVVPHGFNHVALAVYKELTLQPTPPGGVYRSSPPGRTEVLSAEEVRFQLMESKRHLPSVGISEFVLPFGLYNSDTVALNSNALLFDVLTTCDSFLDGGESLRPRLLISNGRDVAATMDLVQSLRVRHDQYRD